MNSAFIGNLIWFILGGWLIGLIYLLGAFILFPLLPFLMPLVGYSFWPFGRMPVSKKAILEYKKSNNLNSDYDDKFLTEKELKAVFDVVNVFEPEDISHVYPEMGEEQFMMDVSEVRKSVHEKYL